MAEARATASTAQREFGTLSPAQWNWKPAAGEWSIAQCVDHLVISAEAYVPTVRAIHAGTKRATVWERLPLLPALFARLVLRALDPDAGRNVKAPAILEPSASAIDPGVLQRFVAAQNELAGLMAATHPAKLATRVTSPVSPVVTYSLLDAYRIIVVHTHLHLRQARAVAASRGFPQAA